MANKALNIKDRLAVRGAIVEPSSMIGGNYLFSLQPHIEGGNLDGALNLTNGGTGSYTIETIDDPDAPYGKVVKFPTGLQSFVAAYGIDIPVDAGDRVYVEATYMIPATDTGTESRFYLGVNGLDKDKKLISSNFGLITYPVSNVTLTADGNWYTLGGYATIPSSHTPYNGSDGGAVRYIKNYVLVNYGTGDREVYLSNVVVRKVEAFKDNADVYFRGNVGIGNDDPAFPLTVEGSVMFNTDTGNDPFYISRLGSTTEALSIKVNDQKVIFESIQDEAADNYGSFQFVLDGGTSYGNFDITRGVAGSSILHVDGNGYIGIDTDSPSAPLEVASPSAEVDTIIVGRNSGNASISGGTGDGAYLILDSSGQYLSLNHYVADDVVIGNGGGNVGVQVLNPISSLHVGDGNSTIDSNLYTTDIVNVSAQNTAPGFNIISAGSSNYNRGVFKATRAKGTLASPTAVSSGDYVFSLLGAAFNGSTVAASAGIEMLVDGVVTQSATPQRIEFQTGTANTRLTRMTIKSSGDVGIGTTAPAARLHIKGSGTTYSADALLVENSSGTDLLKITNTGLFTMDYTGATDTIAIVNYDGNNMNIGSRSVLVGHDAGVSSSLTGSNIVAVGERALYNCTASSTGATVVGYRAGYGAASMQYTAVLGWQAGYNAGSSSSSVFIGQETGRNSTGLSYSVVIGGKAGYGTTHAGSNQNNVIIGYGAAENATGVDDGNTIIGARMLYNSTEVLDNTVIIGSYNAERLRIDSTGKFKFNSYGAGTFTGTATVNLEADSSGNVIERLEERGTFSGTTDSGGRLAISHSIGSTPAIAIITTDAASGSIVTASILSKSSTNVSIITNQASTDISGYYIFSD